MADALNRIYQKSPLWIQNLMVSGQGFLFETKRSNRQEIVDHHRFLMESQWWSEEQFREYQTAQLRALLHMAFTHTDYYGEMAKTLGCTAADFSSPEDIRLLPVLNKTDLRGQEDRFLNKTLGKETLFRAFTSGTTGTPINVYGMRQDFSKRSAFVCRLRSIAGVADPYVTKRAQFTGRDIIPPWETAKAGGCYWRINRPGRALLFSTTHISAETAADYAKALTKFQPELVDGYPSAIQLIAQFALKQNLELPKPKAIIVSAETLTEEARAVMQEAFKCLVHNQYASTEPSCFWFDNEHGELLQSPEYGISEIVDESFQPCELGVAGEVLLTSTINAAMPLIRYRVGDMATMRPSQTSACGRKMPVVESVEGRRDDLIYTKERGFVGRLDPVFKGTSGIAEAQIVQTSLESISLKIVPVRPGDSHDWSQLLEALRKKLGMEVEIKVEVTDAIPRGKNGKFRSVVSLCRDQYPTDKP